MKKALTLVEILIVVAILGILAAVALPTFQSHTQQAKEAAAKDSLRILRNAIELYAAQHNDIPPGYPNGDTSIDPHYYAFCLQLGMATNPQGQYAAPGTTGYPLGPYLSDIPENPFNGIQAPGMLGDSETFPGEPTGTSGWIYKAATKEIRLDWPGTDRDGVRYYDY